MNALYMAAEWWACVSVVVQIAAVLSSSSAMVSLDDIWARAAFQVQDDGIWRVKWDRRQRHHIPREEHHILRILIHPSIHDADVPAYLEVRQKT